MDLWALPEQRSSAKYEQEALQSDGWDSNTWAVNLERSSFCTWLFLLIKTNIKFHPFQTFKCFRANVPLAAFHWRVNWTKLDQLLCTPFVSPLQFKVDGEWWTWIDYERFQELVGIYEQTGGQRSFSALDYMAKTPSWAAFGAQEQGFDPADTRFQRRNKTKDISGCWEAKGKEKINPRTLKDSFNVPF